MWRLLFAACLLLGATFTSAMANSHDQVIPVLQAQAEAWNKGDLDSFMQGYIDSPNTSYVSAGKEVRGYAALRERYVSKYGTKRDTMGKLTFSDLDVTQLGQKNALCIGKWHLDRGAEQQALDGMFTLVLEKTSGGWKIMHDHTSLEEPAK